MKKEIEVKINDKCWSLVEDVTYSTVPAWFGSTYRDLKCSVCIPKHPEDRTITHPLFIWMCGGGFSVMDKDVWWPQIMPLTKYGIVTASIEYRTSNEGVFPMELYDAKSAVRYFRANAERYSIDPKRIFIGGESAGGVLACLAGTTGSDMPGKFDQGQYLNISSRVAGVIDFYGPATNSSAGDKKYTNEQNVSPDSVVFGVEDDAKERMAESNALQYITSDTPPFLIFHGDNDILVDLSQSDALYDALTKAGVYVDYYILKGAGHGEDHFYQKEIIDIIQQFINTAH